MKRAILIYLLLILTLQADSFRAFQKANDIAMQKEADAFQKYKKDINAEFNNYVKEINETYDAYKKELNTYWKNPKLSSQKDWVNYTKDKKTRTTVGFENNTIVLETIAKNPKEAELRLKKALAIVSVDDIKSAIKRDVLQQRIAKVEKKNKKLIIDKPLKREQILAPVIFKKPPTKKRIIEYVNKKVIPKKITVKKSRIHDAKVYSLTVKLPSNTMIKRSKTYENTVRKYAKKFDLPVALVFAIMHTESSFNPFAKSHIPAYGLMQIVPRSAGIDSYIFLHKKRKIPTANYLYNSTNNIEMGSAYLHILYYRYLKSISNPTSRLYCTIAGYNTGAGNVAYAFTKKNNVKIASKKINKMSPDSVYNHLINHLKYDEARHYLKRVSKRINAYKRVYKSNDLIFFTTKNS
ncbi:MAG: murein transglycosylase domain-containing protein [Campylobacterota bacterium]|nr:murein transglycosylase domain-containing protein [Campylobacterota bacterium]